MILVTGFGPYREPLNASGETILSLNKNRPAELENLDDDIAFEIISVDDSSRQSEHVDLEQQLQQLLKKYQPDICIHTGQAPPYNKITIEKTALNSFMQEPIDTQRPVAYWANLPAIDSLKQRLEAVNIPTEYSYYGGQHLCNHILYSSRYFAEQSASNHYSGFIHLPLLPEQVVNQHRNSPSMPLTMLRQAVSLAIIHVLEAHFRN